MSNQKNEENEIIENIKQYLLEKNTIQDNININIEKLGGMCNENFLISIKNNENKIFELYYRKFGKISDCVDHNLESEIIKYLSENNIGPKLYKENKDFRIMEYIPNTIHIEDNELFSQNIINQLYSIINIYNQFSYIYKYSIDSNNKISTAPLNKENNKKLVDKTHYNNCLNIIYKKSKDSFAKFYESFKKNYKNDENINYLEKFKYYIDNFIKIYNEYYPKNGYIIMSHNDMNRYNFMQQTNKKKILCIDHEYASLNLIGYDIVDYMNETNFTFVPDYVFSKDKIDFEKYFEIYLKYIDLFLENNKCVELEDKEFVKQVLKNKKYFMSMYVLINYFWFLCCNIYLNFDNYIKGFKRSFEIAKNLLECLELGIEKIKKLK